MPAYNWPSSETPIGMSLKSEDSGIGQGTEVRKSIISDSVDISEIHIALCGVFSIKGAHPFGRGA